MAEFIFEIFSEEIPARMQAAAQDQLSKLVTEKFEALGIGHSGIKAYSTPRRLVAVAQGVEKHTADKVEEKRGPRVGAPDQALQGFLATNNLTLADLEERDTGKGIFYFATLTEKGRDTLSLLPTVVTDVLRSFTWPKSMTWGSHSFSWVRPIQRLMVVFDGQPVQGSFDLDQGLSIPFVSYTTGHRFLAPSPIQATTFAGYKKDLMAAYVIVDREERCQKILSGATDLCATVGGVLKEDPKLLEEVTGLVEWPVCLWGSIPSAYFSLPQEVLMTSMRVHQKYFSVVTKDGQLMPHFVVVANQVAPDGGLHIVAGNEKVLNARLSDAQFFWSQDSKTKLDDKVARLGGLTFHLKLGTMLEKVERLKKLVLCMAVDASTEDLVRAATLVKADLVTEMVGEFPELQGIMGGYYARHDGEKEIVARALADHYSPQGPQDRCPSASVSVAVAMADKLDTLAGFFLMDEKPTGSKDPYALRRAGLGIIRLILENRMRLNLESLIENAMDLYPALQRPGADKELYDFLLERFRVQLRDQGFRHDHIAAIFGLKSNNDLTNCMDRLQALSAFLKTDDGENLAAAYRRARNIVHAESQKGEFVSSGVVNPDLLKEADELHLAKVMDEVKATARAHGTKEEYGAAMATFANLRKPLDAFFDHVTVNAPEAALRQNRLELLAELQRIMEEVADFSQVSKDHL